MAKKITALEIKIAAKAGSGGKLFGSVGTADLSAALSEAGHDVDKKFIKLAGTSVKRLGKYTASIRLHREVNASLDFEVVKAAEE